MIQSRGVQLEDNCAGRRADIGRRGLLSSLALEAVASAAAPSHVRAGNWRAGEARPGGPFLAAFAAGNVGPWRIDAIEPVTGESLPSAARLGLFEHAEAIGVDGSAWTLRGATSNARHTRPDGVNLLASKQQALGRSGATRAALIPIRKSTAWWSLAQDERRALSEEQSRQIQIGLECLPAIARRQHHGRGFGEPFDFMTWFEYAPQDSEAFETLVQRLRQSEDWQYVDREVDIRLSRI